MKDITVQELVNQNLTRWRDKDDSYWLARLMQEVGELASSLVGDHEDTPEHELQQIASIAINWLDHRSHRRTECKLESEVFKLREDYINGCLV